jgi:hypothetical protein
MFMEMKGLKVRRGGGRWPPTRLSRAMYQEFVGRALIGLGPIQQSYAGSEQIVETQIRQFGA